MGDFNSWHVNTVLSVLFREVQEVSKIICRAKLLWQRFSEEYALFTRLIILYKLGQPETDAIIAQFGLRGLSERDEDSLCILWIF